MSHIISMIDFCKKAATEHGERAERLRLQSESLEMQDLYDSATEVLRVASVQRRLSSRYNLHGKRIAKLS